MAQCAAVWDRRIWGIDIADLVNYSRYKYDSAYLLRVPSFLPQKCFLEAVIILLFSPWRKSGFLDSHIIA